MARWRVGIARVDGITGTGEKEEGAYAKDAQETEVREAWLQHRSVRTAHGIASTPAETRGLQIAFFVIAFVRSVLLEVHLALR